jgi:hypothetical protein
VKTTETRIEQLEHRLGLAGDDAPLTFRICVRVYDGAGAWHLEDALRGEPVTPPEGSYEFTLAIGG